VTEKETHRSPIDLVLVADGQRALTANHTSDSVTLIDLRQRKVLAETSVGRKPAAVVCTADGRRAAVSNSWSGTVSLLDVEATTLRTSAEIKVGSLPRGLAFALDGKSLYVALSGSDEVVQLDLQTQKITQRWPAPREPRRLVLSDDGRILAAASGRSGQVRCWDTRLRQLISERSIGDAFNLRGLTFTPDGKDLLCAHVVRRDFPVSRHNIEEGWVSDSRLSRLPVAADVRPPLWQIALDTRGRAVGDPEGVAFSRQGDRLALTAGGTHEVLLFETAAIPWSRGDPGDFLDEVLSANDGKLRRIELGGRPVAAAFGADGSELVVANYLLDSVQVVDVRAGKIVRTIGLADGAKPLPARQGEAIFYDARRSHNQWFSCHTCHTDGHTCGLTFDTLNDDSYGNPKLTPSLRGVTKTGPWTWHGWQSDLGKSVEKSLTETMFGPRPSAEDVQALLAYLETLEQPPNPHPGDGDAVARGKLLFHGKAKCARCHHGEQYTSEKNFDVHLEPDGSRYLLWNPPSLRGVWDRGPFLHDGRAKTLEDVLEKHHTPQKLGGAELTAEELQDLLSFLRSL
jgi:YVTN family beta-propeller protein